MILIQMKTDIEEPVKKNWKVFIILLLLLIFLLGTGVLLIVWFLENSKDPTYKTDTSRVVMSGIGVLLLIVTLIVSLVNIYRPGKKKSKGTVQRSGKEVSKKKPASRRRTATSHRKVKK